MHLQVMQHQVTGNMGFLFLLDRQKRIHRFACVYASVASYAACRRGLTVYDESQTNYISDDKIQELTGVSGRHVSFKQKKNRTPSINLHNVGNTKSHTHTHFKNKWADAFRQSAELTKHNDTRSLIYIYFLIIQIISLLNRVPLHADMSG